MGHLHGRLIAFDLDGTLIDSSRDLANSVNALLGELGAPPLPLQTVTKMIGEGAKVLIRRALAESGIHADPGAIGRFLEIYDAKLLEHTRPYDGIIDIVRAARRQARVAVLSNNPQGPSEKVLAGLGMRELFDDLIGSDGTYPRKPDPAGLRALMDRAGATPERTLMVGDSLIDYQTAKNAATGCCLVAYGFSNHTLDGVPTDGALVATDASTLGDIIERFLANS